MDNVSFANRALAAIGARSVIANFAEPSAEAQNVALIYQPTVLELLRGYRWNFARYQTALAVWKAAKGQPENPAGALPSPPLPWLYSYLWPSDCLDPRFIVPMAPPSLMPAVPLTPVQQYAPPTVSGRAVKFATAGDIDTTTRPPNPIKVILCNLAQAELVYTSALFAENPNLWDLEFGTALVGRLAQQLVIPLSGDKSLAAMAIKKGQAVEDKAAADNLNDGIETTDYVPDWIEARGFAGGFESYGGRGVDE